jgi:hypothetical protein
MADTTDHGQTTAARLLPWQVDGKPQYLHTDASGESPFSRLADDVEAQQLANASEVLRLSGQPEVDACDVAELRWIVERLRESLTETLRIADSRGARL